jgi:DNA-binding HxlR family transcriptional regulator
VSPPDAEAVGDRTVDGIPSDGPASDGLVAALDLVGQRWALLIVRELLAGPRRFGDLQRALPRIPSNILTTRLKDLQESGVAYRVPMAHNVLAYRLTPRGEDLRDSIEALERWGARVPPVD